MTEATTELVSRLCNLIDEQKYLLLIGATGVGKTVLAEKIANESSSLKYHAQGIPTDSSAFEIITAIVSIHESYSYEDFVEGISVTTKNGNVEFHNEDKIFNTLVKAANISWENGENKKYFLILDDIGRGAISGILGNALPLIEVHGNSSYSFVTQDGTAIKMTPNIYIIATESTTVSPIEQFNYSFLRHFYIYYVENDYRFMDDNASNVYSEFDVSANALFYRSREIVLDNLKNKYQVSNAEKEQYILGHGMFKPVGTTMMVRHQLLPTLKQYIKDGILDRTAKAQVTALEALVTGQYTKDTSLAKTNLIEVRRKNVDVNKFLNEDKTQQPVVNLVSRIKNQGLLDDTEIINGMLFNASVLLRKQNTLDGQPIMYSNGYLYVKKSERNQYKFGTTVNSRTGKKKSPRYFYSSNIDDSIKVNSIDYTVAQEMQPKEYFRKYDELDSDTFINERGTLSPNSVLYRLVRTYYKRIVKNCEGYLEENPSDNNIRNLQRFADAEYKSFATKTRTLHPLNTDDDMVNLKANDDFRKLISTLVLLWKDRGEFIRWGGEIIKVEGVYKVSVMNKYREFYNAMDLLNIHQMIMQGPPGTSKTYSSREFLKFIAAGIDNDSYITDQELDDYQVESYEPGCTINSWSKTNSGVAPAIAWDIVQFHPSYGYEDFVRGIEVSTQPNPDGHSSMVSYDTVNKILGNMASLASRPENKNCKFFLLIDEINRANLATVFGELIYGLEYRDKAVATPYTVDNTNKITLPDNLYIIGTMNTADKSIGGIDYAIRRRFLFFSLLPDRNVIGEFNIKADMKKNEREAQTAINKKAVKLFDCVAKLFDKENLNDEYYRDDVQIGHTYFLVTSEEQLYLRFRLQILPILREYYKDGMFQFINTETEDNGWDGFLACISGTLDLNNNEDKVKDIFNNLIAG